MACINTNIRSCEYLYWYLNDQRLNEFLWRITNGKLKRDIRNFMTSDTFYDKSYSLDVFLVNKIKQTNDIYMIIRIYKNNVSLCHFTMHFLMNNNREETRIGPIHIINNTNNSYASRVNLNFNTNSGNISRLLLKKSNHTIKNRFNTNNIINHILGTIIKVLQEYFNKNSSLSLDNKLYSGYNPHLKDIITYYKAIKSPIKVQQTTFTSSQYGGKKFNKTIKKSRK
jgi:hypothetical protein